MKRCRLVLSAAFAAWCGPASAAPAPPAAAAAIPVVLLVDGGAGQVLYARRPKLRFLPASTTKAMTAYTAFEMIGRGELDIDRRFVVSPQTFSGWHGKGTSMNLASGEAVSVGVLLQGITTISANDAAIVLAEGVAGSVPLWAARMNAEGARLGLRCSHFATPNGWPDGGATYVCAEDLVKIGRALAERHPALYRRFIGRKQMAWNGIVQQNKDPTLGVVCGADGIKTGHTGEAGYNFLASAARDGRRLYLVVGGARSEPERAAAARELLEWGFAAWHARPLFAAGAVVAEAQVQGGAARSVSLVADRPIALAIPAGSAPQIALRLHYRGPLSAPIARRAPVAELEMVVAGQPSVRVPLVAGRAVPLAGPLERLRNGLMGLFE